MHESLNAAHYIRVAAPVDATPDYDKKLIKPKDQWASYKPSLKEVNTWKNKKQVLGLVPASVGCVVIDVDQGADNAVDEVVQHLDIEADYLVVNSRSEGGRHIWLKTKDDWPSGNKFWRTEVGKGEIRYDKGYIHLWHDALDQLDDWLTKDPNPCADWELFELISDSSKTSSGDWEEGERNETLNKAVYHAIRTGEPIDPIIDKAKRAGLQTDEIAETVRSAQKAARKHARVNVKTKDGAGLLAAFTACKIDIRYNELLRKPEIKAGEKASWQELDDAKENSMMEFIAMNFAYEHFLGKRKDIRELRFSKQAWQTALDWILSSKKFNPGTEFIESLPVSNRPDDYLFEVMNEMFFIEDTPLNRWLVDAMWVGVIQRMMEPGCDMRIMPVLVGAQEAGKSSFIKHMLPQDMLRYFQPRLTLKGDTIEKVTNMLGMILCECAELHGASASDVNELKAWLTPGVDQVRLKFDRRAQRIPRTGYIIGTANKDQPLPKDPTGNTRFGIVEVEEGLAPPYIHLPEVRMDCWSVAKRLYDKGLRVGYMPKEFHDQQSEVNKDFTPTNEIISNRIASIPVFDGHESLENLAKFCEYLNFNDRDFKSRGHENDFRQELLKAGYVKRRRRVNGHSVARWHHPNGKFEGAGLPAAEFVVEGVTNEE